MIGRSLSLPVPPVAAFFLWGPRQTGKSTLLRTAYPEAPRIDLLASREFSRYSLDPGRLREIVAAERGPGFVVIDEIQKVPALLDEVHWLIENRGTTLGFARQSRSIRLRLRKAGAPARPVARTSALPNRPRASERSAATPSTGSIQA